MKFFRLFALLLVVPLVFGVTSCGKKDEPKDQPATDTTAKVEEQKPTVTKEDYMKVSTEVMNYLKSPEFKTMFIEAIKEAAKDPATFDAKLNETQMKVLEEKMLELVKPYGITSKEQMQEAGKPFENDPDVKAFNETMMKDMMGVLAGIYGDAELLKAVPKDVKKKLEDMKKGIEAMVAPKAEEPAAKGDEAKKGN